MEYVSRISLNLYPDITLSMIREQVEFTALLEKKNGGFDISSTFVPIGYVVHVAAPTLYPNNADFVVCPNVDECIVVTGIIDAFANPSNELG